eukprot:9563094-Alexandrium_andersonii.AAC.1
MMSVLLPSSHSGSCPARSWLDVYISHLAQEHCPRPWKQRSRKPRGCRLNHADAVRSLKQ